MLKQAWRVVAPLALVVLVTATALLAWRWRHGTKLPALMPTWAPAEEKDNRPSAGLELRAEVVASADGPRVRLVWNEEAGAEATLFRSTRSLDQTRLHLARYPITVYEVKGRVHVDEAVADHARYFYQLAMRRRGGDWQYSAIASVEVPDRPLPPLRTPRIEVDKTRYLLEVWDGDRVAKRYPIALGRNPRRRKLHQDNASTPEGRYRIAGCQPQATFYRAYDLDYPNAIDRLRYDTARAAGRLPADDPPIGGEIQIHGKGIDANWTFGCIALRNDDMDELFSHSEIGAATPVIVRGSELTALDLLTIDRVRGSAEEVRRLQQRLQPLGFYREPLNGEVSPGTLGALGAFQLAHDLPLTCDFDARTVRELGRQPAGGAADSP